MRRISEPSFDLFDKNMNNLLPVGISTTNKIKLNYVRKVVAVFPQDARDDVGGAQNTGMLGILVRTGKNKLLHLISS